MMMASGELKTWGMSFADEGVSGIDSNIFNNNYFALRELRGTETNPTGIGEFDVSLEKILHLLYL